MTFIKNFFLCMILISGYQLLESSATKNAPEFDRVMQHFTEDFQKFAHVFLHGSKEEKKELSKVGAKSLESCANLYDYVKKHPDEKRFVPQEHRHALEQTIKKLPHATEKGKKLVQTNQKKLNDLISKFIHSSSIIPTYNPKKEKLYNTIVIQAIKDLLELQKFIKKNPGYLISSTNKDDLIKAINKLKTVHLPSKVSNKIKKYEGEKPVVNKSATKTKLTPLTAPVAQLNPLTPTTSMASVQKSSAEPASNPVEIKSSEKSDTPKEKSKLEKTDTVSKTASNKKIQEPVKKIIQVIENKIVAQPDSAILSTRRTSSKK